MACINYERDIMHFESYQKEAAKFAVYEASIYPFLGLAEEVGEFIGLVAKEQRGDDMIARYGSEDNLTLTIMKEMGDILWMLANCAEELNLNLGDVAELNLQKLADRKKRDVIKGAGDSR